MSDPDLTKAINESGFPLQLGLAQLARSVHSWHVILQEHPWRDQLSGDEKFIDLVLKGKNDGPSRLVVECKRARDTEWLFLREPPGDYQGRNQCLNIRSRLLSRRLTPIRAIDQWIDVPILPGSPEASYCVIRKNRQRSQDLLEKTAAEVVRATDALAYQETTIYERESMGLAHVGQGIARVYVPVIVSTAKMFICDADYGNVDLETGEVADAVIEEVSVVRFMKSLGATDPRQSSATSVKEFARQSERSVLVVQAAHFAEVLERWELSKRMPPSLLEALLAP